ncbi:AAA family ATPase [Roseibium sp.]|uniref:bifunctional aminoglycoside phosphotransferase/ATP-binding protein n=1 Tax=Roseibium sp. TaxID=1936156 RepID=UPI003BAB5356
MDQSQNSVFHFFEEMGSHAPQQPGFERIDTHANVIFLIGDRAYKMKRAVRYPFLDYSTLALREAACKTEITFNRPNAPQIYREAVPVTRAADGRLALGGTGETVDWVVVMNRFERRGELDILAGETRFPDDLSDKLARMMVAAHAAAPERSGIGFFDELASYVDQNEAAFHEHPDLFPVDEVRHLTEQSRHLLATLRELILKRGEKGLIRRCHGDAHLRNIVLIDDEPVLFDAVEFSDAIATGDVLYDLAFLLMDLWERGQSRSASRVFNRYLDLSRLDTHAEGLAALPFYLMMRAAIRSKIAASAALAQSDPAQSDLHKTLAQTYFGFAQSFLEPSRPELVAIGGLSGTGKTTLAYELAPDIGRAPGARVLRTDVMRKRLLDIPEDEAAPRDAYTLEASRRVYAEIDNALQSVLAAGHSAIFDAVFAAESERDKIRRIAGSIEAGFTGLWLTAPGETLKDRVSHRTGDASDATADVVDTQLGYDIGTMTWAEIDASQSPEHTAESAREELP